MYLSCLLLSSTTSALQHFFLNLIAFLLSLYELHTSVKQNNSLKPLVILDVACCYLWLFSLYINVNIGKNR